jgi:hypothetical protein
MIFSVYMIWPAETAFLGLQRAFQVSGLVRS